MERWQENVGRDVVLSEADRTGSAPRPAAAKRAGPTTPWCNYLLCFAPTSCIGFRIY